jgi:branched-chain amino acid aminotransferase
LLTEGRYYEVLFENKDGYITEGSRTNIFLIKDDTLYTPPAGEVLSGITRQKIIEISERNGIPVIEKSIARGDLSQFGTLFLTGTSAKLLPIKHMEDISFIVDHPLMKHLMESYDLCIASYIDDFSRSHRAVSN